MQPGGASAVALAVGLALVVCGTEAAGDDANEPPTAAQKAVLRRIVALEDQSRMYRERQELYAQKADELQRQADGLSRQLLGRKGVDPKAPTMAPEMQDLRRLIAPEGPQGRKTAQKPKVNRVGEAASTRRMPKAVVAPEKGAADDHVALVKKAHEATKRVHKEAAAVVKHVKKVSKTIDTHGGSISMKHLDVECRPGDRRKLDDSDDYNAKPQFCTGAKLGKDDERQDSMHTTFPYKDARRNNANQTDAMKAAKNYYSRINPQCSSWRREFKLNSLKSRKSIVKLLNTASSLLWVSKDWVIPRAVEHGTPDISKRYSNPKCCSCLFHNPFSKYQKDENGVSKACVCDKYCRVDPVDPKYGYMKSGTVVRIRGGCYHKWAVDHGDNGVKVDSGCHRLPGCELEKFTVVDAGDAPTPIFDKKDKYTCNQQKYVAFKGGKDQKYCASEKGRWICNRNKITDWERFEVKSHADQFVTIRSKRTNKLCQDNKDSITCDSSEPTWKSNGCNIWLVQPWDNSHGEGSTNTLEVGCNDEELGESQHAKFFIDTIKRAVHHVTNTAKSHVTNFAKGKACELLKPMLGHTLKGVFMNFKPIIIRAVKQLIQKKSITEIIKTAWYHHRQGIWSGIRFATMFKDRLLYPTIAPYIGDPFMMKDRLKEDYRKGMIPSSSSAKCAVDMYFGFLMKFETKFYLAPDGKNNEPSTGSQPMRIVVHRYPVHNKAEGNKYGGEKKYGGKRPLCQAFFEVDAVHCEEWKHGKQCGGSLVDKPVRSGLLTWRRTNRTKANPDSPQSWAVEPNLWSNRNDCESWFVFIQSAMSALASVATASSTVSTFSGKLLEGGRRCFYPADEITNLIEKQDKKAPEFMHSDPDDKSDTFDGLLKGGKCTLKTGYHNPDSKGYFDRRRAVSGRRRATWDPTKQEWKDSGDDSGGCRITYPYDWSEDKCKKWKRGLHSAPWSKTKSQKKYEQATRDYTKAKKGGDASQTRKLKRRVDTLKEKLDETRGNHKKCWTELPSREQCITGHFDPGKGDC